jgi:site-specific DNA-methyltransferase (adenine-specific)
MKPNTIYCGDSCQVLESWSPGSIDLVFADPPFNIGYVYDNYRDDLPNAEYVAWTRRWMAACQRVLKPTGSFYIAIGDDFAADVRIIGRELGLHLRNWIIWHYTFGQNMKGKFCRAHTHIFYFTADPKTFTFNDHALRFPSARHTEYQDLRANPAGRLPDDVWTEFPRVCGTFKERAGFHGCQMPEALLMRIVMASSNPGEIVLDPFIGSGTTAVAAKRLGRKYIGIDLSKEYARHTEQRLATVRDESAAPAVPGAWAELHVQMLAQVYAETKVSLDNLLRNKVALEVISRSLRARIGAAYSVAEIGRQLEALRGELPKLPNDVPFVPRNHVTQEGKRYERRIFRCKARRRTTNDWSDGQPPLKTVI